MISDGIGFLVIHDWRALEPAMNYYRDVWKHPDVFVSLGYSYNSVKKVMDEAGVKIPPGLD
jgi:hypothetical protein